MEFEPEEKDIVELLEKLKNRGGTYPRKMLASRRHSYLSQVASIGAGLGFAAVGVKAAAKTAKSGTTSAHLPLMPTLSASTLVEAILVTAIVVQVGIVAYNYRDRLANFFTGISATPTIVEFMPTSQIESSAPEIVPALSATPMLTPSPTGTLSITVTVATTEPPIGETGEEGLSIVDVTATATPKDDNGNHYGQTPNPTSKPKDEPKPTKSKGRN